SDDQWAKVYVSQAQPLDLTHVHVNGPNDTDEHLWRLSVSLDADPYLSGSEVTLDLGTVLNNPTLASGGSVIELPEIKGDAPAPLNVLVSSARDRKSTRLNSSHV